MLLKKLYILALALASVSASPVTPEGQHVCCIHGEDGERCVPGPCAKRSLSISARTEDFSGLQCSDCPKGSCCTHTPALTICHGCQEGDAVEAANNALTLRPRGNDFCKCKKKGDCCFDFAGQPICGNQCSKRDAFEQAKRALDAPAVKSKIKRSFETLPGLLPRDTELTCCVDNNDGTGGCWSCDEKVCCASLADAATGECEMCDSKANKHSHGRSLATPVKALAKAPDAVPTKKPAQKPAPSDRPCCMFQGMWHCGTVCEVKPATKREPTEDLLPPPFLPPVPCCIINGEHQCGVKTCAGHPLAPLQKREPDNSPPDSQITNCCVIDEVQQCGEQCEYHRQATPEKRTTRNGPGPVVRCCYIQGLRLCGISICNGLPLAPPKTRATVSTEPASVKTRQTDGNCCRWGGENEVTCGPLCMTKKRRDEEVVTISAEDFGMLRMMPRACSVMGDITVCAKDLMVFEDEKFVDGALVV